MEINCIKVVYKWKLIQRTLENNFFRSMLKGIIYRSENKKIVWEAWSLSWDISKYKKVWSN
jgi:hypothetical protein